MKKNICILLSSVASAALLLASCLSEKEGESLLKAGDEVEFIGYVGDESEVRTRDLTTKYIASYPFDMDFYIHLSCYSDEACTDLTHTAFGTYVVPTSYEGRLSSKESNDPLSWYDLNQYHTFYAWNIPWDADYVIPEDDVKSGKGMDIVFDNSSEDEYEDSKNNSKYEHFVGAKSVKPYSYKKHGRYVDLTFHHLVSKIRIGSFILIQASGTIQEHLQADITFVGMPTEATFYPHPTEGGGPRVVPKEYDPNNGVTYFIHNTATEEDIFYICPEVDFSNVDFQVRVKDKNFGTPITYYGTFDNVTFTREPGTDYDREEGGDSKILHAGEMMTLNIVLIPGIGPGLAVVISEWSTDDPTDSQYHTHPGIYSDAEIKQMHDHFADQRSYGSDDPEVERLFEMYGQKKDIDGDGTEENVFVLYENVDITSGKDSNIFPVPPGYVVDGMGHTITLKSNRGSNGDFTYTQTYFNVGAVRDVWLTDGTNTIYIDKQGYVWIQNANKDGFVKTEHCLTELDGNNKSYDISCETGIVHKSTYYNNNIVGS